jgi:hypothetical protein
LRLQEGSGVTRYKGNDGGGAKSEVSTNVTQIEQVRSNSAHHVITAEVELQVEIDLSSIPLTIVDFVPPLPFPFHLGVVMSPANFAFLIDRDTRWHLHAQSPNTNFDSPLPRHAH